MAGQKTLRLISALVVIAAGLLATTVTWIDRTGAYTGAGTVGYYALPLAGLAGGVGALVARLPARRSFYLLVGVMSLIGWYVLLVTQTEVNDSWI